MLFCFGLVWSPSPGDYHCGLIGYQVKKKLPPPKSSSDTPNMFKHVPALSNNSFLPALRSNADPQVGIKRAHRNFSAEPGHVKKIARSGPDGDVGQYVPLQIQPDSTANIGNQPSSIIDQNRLLHRRCLQHKRKLEELGQTVAQLTAKLEGAKDEYARMFKQLDTIKSEK